MIGPIDEATLNQLHANFQNGRQFGASPSPVLTAKPGGNFFTHLLPSAGGIAGGVGGGALGGALAGTAILPGIGTAAGGLLGALLGGAAGGAAGKIGENAIEHQGLGNGVAGQAIENGLLSAGPIRLIKGVGTAGKVLAGIGDNAAAADVAAQGGNKLLQALNAGGTAGMSHSAFMAGAANKLDNIAGNAAQKGLKINDTGFLSQFKKDTGGEPVGDFARRFGIPHNGLEATNFNVLQPGYAAHAAAVDSLGTISKSDIQKAVQAQVAHQLASPIPDVKAAGQAVLDKANSILENLPEQVPASTLNQQKSVLSGLIKGGASDGPTQTNNDILTHVGDAFRNVINQTADRQGITVPADLAKLGYKSTRVGDLGQELHNLTTLMDKAEVKSWQGTGTNPVSLSGSAALGGFGGPAGLATGLGIQAINSGTGKKLTAKGIDAVASRLDKSAVKSGANPLGISAVTKRVAPLGLLGALTGSNQSNTSQTTTDPTMNNTANNMSTLSQNGVQNASALTPDAGQQSPQEDTNSPLNPANVEQGVAAILANGGKLSDATAYMSLVKSLSDLKQSQNPTAKAPSASQQQQANNALSALSNIQDLQQQLKANPSLQKLAAVPGNGVTQGLVGSLTGTGQYRNDIANISDVLGRMRSGAALSAGEEQRYLAMLPKAFDSPQTVQFKLGQLQDLLSRFANPQAASEDLSANGVSLIQ